MTCKNSNNINNKVMDTSKNYYHSTIHELPIIDKKPMGLLKYFYHSRLSKVPIRDVTNELGNGTKTEPHIEIGKGKCAENYISKCMQKIIKKVCNEKYGYLFLVTTCYNDEVNKEFNMKYGKGTNQFIVGYIDVESKIDFGDHTSIVGPVKIFSFNDSILLRDNEWLGFNLDQPMLLSGYNPNRKKPFNPFFKEKENVEYTEKILKHFSGKTDILDACVSEMKRLDGNENPCYQKRANNYCMFKEGCLRH